MRWASSTPNCKSSCCVSLDGAPYYRLGGNRKIQVDVRVIAATNQPLERRVQTGEFRRDLYHRLSQFHLTIPPLRERPEDIVALADHFLHSLAPEKRFSRQAKDRLLVYYWPGNIRELKSVVLQAGTFREELEIGADCLSLERELTAEQVDSGASGRDAQAAAVGTRLRVEVISAVQETQRQAGPHDLGSLERKAIIDTLAKSGGHQGIAALELGISRRTLSRKLKLYNIDPARSQGRSQGDVAELGGEQQLRFRYSLEIPVSIAADGKQFLFKSRNISCGGVCLQGAQEVSKNTAESLDQLQAARLQQPHRGHRQNRLGGPGRDGRCSLHHRPAALTDHPQPVAQTEAGSRRLAVSPSHASVVRHAD